MRRQAWIAQTAPRLPPLVLGAGVVLLWPGSSDYATRMGISIAGMGATLAGNSRGPQPAARAMAPSSCCRRPDRIRSRRKLERSITRRCRFVAAATHLRTSQRAKARLADHRAFFQERFVTRSSCLPLRGPLVVATPPAARPFRVRPPSKSSPPNPHKRRAFLPDHSLTQREHIASLCWPNNRATSSSSKARTTPRTLLRHGSPSPNRRDMPVALPFCTVRGRGQKPIIDRSR